MGFSAACERNKGALLDQLALYFGAFRRVLEVGGGTGQHAVHFASHLAHLVWQTTEQPARLAALQARVTAEGPANLLPAIALDVEDRDWPRADFDAVFTANTLHILSWPQVEHCFAGVSRTLDVGGVFGVYGPFRRHGHTHESNERFDAELKSRDPASGIRDLDDLEAFGTRVGLNLVADVLMPANNQLLIWRRVDVPAG